ncbi:hypothetical protein EDC04DRAFT_2926311 [Pisolithus marmoratus]|nr:hypothetical protein EDC04DRAFT_2926311 [Pisolithus marmoratus]
MHESEHQGMLRRANPKTIQDKVLVGYQGWFTCAGDGEPIYPGHHGWLHWTDGIVSQGGRPNVDLWPDTSEYSPSELFPIPGLNMANGEPAVVFSSRHPKTVRRHFHWMALHGVDGAFLQRFAGQCDLEMGNHGIRRVRDEVGERVREAAEAEGTMSSGVSPDRIQRVLEQDWIHLLRDQRILDSPNYLREKERPVVALWGFGFNDRNHTPELACQDIGGHRHPTRIRNPGFVIRGPLEGMVHEEDADRWGEERVKADADYLRSIANETGKKVDYIPVVLPGGSGYNLSKGKWGLNGIKRNGGRFLWKQIYNARRAGVRTIYGAMWDEYDEGTVFMPVVSRSSQLPVHRDFNFIALDVDGCDLPSDWYMRIAGPHYENVGAEIHTVEADPPHHAWQDAEARDAIDDAPPPYSIEDVVQKSQHISLATGRSNTAAMNAPLPSGPPPPVPARNPSISASSIPTSMSMTAGGSPQSPQSIPQSARPVPVNMSTRPIVSAQPPPPTNVSSRPTSVTASAPPPGSLSFSTTPHLHHSSDGGPEMPMPSSTTPLASPSQAHPSRPSTASSQLVGRPVSPPYNPSAGRPQDLYAIPYLPSGGWSSGQGHSHVDFPAPMPAPEHYAYPNQSNPPPMGPHLPHRYGSSPAPPMRPHSHSSYASLPGPSSPPPPIPPRPPIHPQSSGYYPPYVQGSSYGGATYADYNYNPNGYNNGNTTGGTLTGKALSVVESVAGRDARTQLERGVKTLANTGSSILNKFK